MPLNGYLKMFAWGLIGLVIGLASPAQAEWPTRISGPGDERVSGQVQQEDSLPPLAGR